MKKLILALLLACPLPGLADLDAGVRAYGRGDHATALKEFRPLAEAGNADAQYNLGVMHARGEGMSVDHAGALKWFRLAAEQGNALAQYNLGVIYDTGVGVPRDLSEAVKWFRRAAEQGNARAQFNLGVMYDSGEGVAADAAEAVKWFRRAADQGVASAQYNLGNVYREGRGVKEDAGEAVKWFRLAAEQGFADGQNNLGFMYASGLGIAQDERYAYAWFALAAAQGHRSAGENRDLVRSRMTAVQLAEAQELVRTLSARAATRITATAADPQQYVTRTRVSYRAGAGLGHDRLGVLDEGVAFTVTGKEGKWLRVRLSDGRTVFVHGDYARPAATPGGAVIASSHVTNARVNVRAGPGLRHKAIAWLAPGTTIEVLDATKAWARVRLDDSRIGYVAAEHVVPR